MSQRSHRKILLLTWIVFSLLGLVRFAETVHPRFDSGAYIIAAQSIAQGHGLTHLAHPENPPFTTYPPVIPILLSPFALLGNADFTGLKAGMILLFSLTLLGFALTFGRYLEGRRLAVAVALLGSGSLLAFAGRIQGEVPFTLLALLSVVFADRWFESYRRTDLVGALVCLSLLCNSRQAGIAWAAGFLVACLVSPRTANDRAIEIRRRLVAAVMVVILIVVPWALLIQSIQPGSLSPESSSMLRNDGWDPAKGRMGLLSRAMLGRVKMNLEATATFLPESLFFTYELSRHTAVKVLLIPLLLLILIGFADRALFRRSVLEATTLAYLALILITPWLREPRFYTVILPLMIVYLSVGVDRVGKWVNLRSETGPRLFAAICLGIVAANLVGVVVDDRVNPWSAKENKDYQLALFAKDLLPNDAVVLAHDHCAFYLLTGRKSLSFTPSEQKFHTRYKLDAYLARGGRVDYIAWTQGDDKLVADFLQSKDWETALVAQQDGWFLHKRLN